MDAFDEDRSNISQLIEALDLVGQVQAKKTTKTVWFASTPCLLQATGASCPPTAFPSNPGRAAANTKSSRTVNPSTLGQAIGDTGAKTVYRSEPCLLRATSASGRQPGKFSSSAPNLATESGDVRRENAAKNVEERPPLETVVEAPGDDVVRRSLVDGPAQGTAAVQTLPLPTTGRTKRSLWKRTKLFAANCVRYVGRRVC